MRVRDAHLIGCELYMLRVCARECVMWSAKIAGSVSARARARRIYVCMSRSCACAYSRRIDWIRCGVQAATRMYSHASGFWLCVCAGINHQLVVSAWSRTIFGCVDRLCWCRCVWRVQLTSRPMYSHHAHETASPMMRDGACFIGGAIAIRYYV